MLFFPRPFALVLWVALLAGPKISVQAAGEGSLRHQQQQANNDQSSLDLDMDLDLAASTTLLEDDNKNLLLRHLQTGNTTNITESPSESPQADTASPTVTLNTGGDNTTISPTIFPTSNTSSNNNHDDDAALTFRCLQLTAPSGGKGVFTNKMFTNKLRSFEREFSVSTATAINQLIEEAASSTPECPPDGNTTNCLRRVDFEVESDVVVTCDDANITVATAGVDCVFFRFYNKTGTFAKDCAVQVGAATALILQDLKAWETPVTVTDAASHVTLDNVNVEVQRDVYCMNGQGVDKNDDKEAVMDLESFDPEDYSCYYKEQGPIVDPPHQASLTGVTDLRYAKLSDFVQDLENNLETHNYFDIESTVSLTLGASDKIPLKWMLQTLTNYEAATAAEQDEEPVPPITLQIQTDTPSPNMVIATDIELEPMTTTTTSTAGDFGIETVLDLINNNKTLPSTIFLQSTTEDACITSISLRLGNFTLFVKDMTDFSTCSSEFPVDYDADRKCVRLSATTKFQDLALDLQQGADADCTVASLRRDPFFMESFTFHYEGEGLAIVDSMDDLPLTNGQALDDHVRLPVFPAVMAQSSQVSLSKMNIMAYDKVLWEWDASATFHCLSTCQPFANPNSLFFKGYKPTSPGSTTNNTAGDSETSTTQDMDGIMKATFDLSAKGCDKLASVMLYEDLTGEEVHKDITGEEACTQEETPLDTVGEIDGYLATLLANGKRTLRIVPEVSANGNSTALYDFPDLAVPPHVRVQIDGAESEIIIEDVFVEVSVDGMLEFLDVTFGSHEAGGEPTVLINSGTMVFDSCTLQHGVQLESLAGKIEMSGGTMAHMDVALKQGLAEFSYGKIHALNSFSNDAGSSLVFDQMDVSSTNFSFYSGEGGFTLVDAQVVYSLPDDDIRKAFCAVPSLVSPFAFAPSHKVKDMDECQALCDSTPSCKGIWLDSEGLTLDSDDGSAACGLCLPESCSFDCNIEGSYILHKQPVVPFTEVGRAFCPLADPIFVDGLPSLANSNDCRGWCSTLSFCQAYTFDASAATCAFYEEPSVSLCDNPTNNTLLVDTNHDAGLGKFVNVPDGMCFPDLTPQLIDVGSGVQTWLPAAADCAAFCGALAECSAFDIDPVSSQCRYFAWDTMLETSASCTRATYLSIQDSSFPLGLSSSVKHFKCSSDTSLSQESLVSGGLKVCETQCHTDSLCLAYSYKRNDATGSAPDCFLWKDADHLDWLLNPERCQISNGETYLVTRRVDFIEDNSTSLPCDEQSILAPVEDAIVLDQCKAVCLRTAGCNSLSFESEDFCRLTCPDDAPNATSSQAPVYKKEIAHLKMGHVDYVSVQTCSTTEKIEHELLESTKHEAMCRYLCDLTDKCMGYSIVDSTCELYQYVETRECEAESEEQPKQLKLAFQGKHLSEFHPAPSSSEFVAPGFVESRGNGSFRACFAACLASSTCRAVAIDWSQGGECTLYASTDYEASDGVVEVGGRQVFLSYSKNLYEEIITNSTYNGQDLIQSYSDVKSRRACSSLCNIRGSCLAIEYSPTSQTCKLMGGDKQISTNQEGADPYIMSRMPVNPFVKVQSAEQVCPDSSALIFGLAGIWHPEACQSLCLSHAKCGITAHNSANGICELYESASFLQGSCDSFDPVNAVYVSYMQFLEQDSMSFASLTPVEDSDTDAICVSGGAQVANYTDIHSESACATLCKESPKLQACKAFLYDSTEKTCELKQFDFEVAKCQSSSTVLGLSYTRMAFTSLEDACLSDTGSSNLINAYSGIRDYPECSALCEATFGCKAFNVAGAMCKLFKSSESISSCVGTGSSSGTFVYFSDKLYTWLGPGYCAASATPILELGNMELEACKQLCDVTGACESYEHNVQGECLMYQGRDFFECPNSQRELYISSARLYNVEVPVKMAELRNTCLTLLDDSSCFYGSCDLGDSCNAKEDCKASLLCESLGDSNAKYCVLPEISSATVGTGSLPHPSDQVNIPESTNQTLVDCREECVTDDSCIGVYRQGDACLNLKLEDLQRVEPSSDCGNEFDTELLMKYRENPYQKMKTACLKNPLDIGPFERTELVDCINICDSYSTCRHFTHSIEGACAIYAAQVGGVDEDCDMPDGVTAYLNSRSFVDTVEFMGVPERVFAQAHGLSYDECAATCSRLDQCNAFIHDAGFRQSAAAFNTIEPERLVVQISKELRHLVVALDFASTALTNRNGNGNIGLVGLSSEDDLSVGNYHNQALVFEDAGGIPNRVRIRFQHSDFCLVAIHSRVWAIPCAEETDQRKINFFVAERGDGTFGLESVEWDETRPHPACLRYASDSESTLKYAECNSENTGFDRASRPFRLSPDGAKGTCLKTDGATVTLEECDPSDEHQKFTYLFGAKQWVQQRKNEPNVLPKVFDEFEGLCLPDTLTSVDTQNEENCEHLCSINPLCVGWDFKAADAEPCILRKEPSSLGEFEFLNGMFDKQFGRQSCEASHTWMRGYTPSITSDVGEQKGRTTIAGSCMNDRVQQNLIEKRDGDWIECTARCNELDNCVGFEYCPRGKDCSHSRQSAPGNNGFQSITPFGDKDGSTGACLLRSAIGKATCIPAAGDDVELLTTFQKGKVRAGNTITEGEQCLGIVSGDGGAKELRLGTCDSQSTQVLSQSLLGPGNTIQFGNDCLSTSLNSATGKMEVVIEPCTSGESKQKWIRDSVCQLTTRESTKPFKLESVDSEGRCLAMDRRIFDDTSCDSMEASHSDVTFKPNGHKDVGTALCDTADATLLQYFYAQAEQDSRFLLKLVNGTDSHCVKRLEQPVNSQYLFDRLEEDAIMWGSCDRTEVGNQWEITNGNGGSTFKSAETNDNTEVKIYELAHSSCNDKVVSTNRPLEPNLKLWKKYGLGNSAVELAVKPKALIQEITDPEVKLQLWLFSQDGRRSRLLLSRIDLFAEFPAMLSGFLGQVDQTVQKIGGGLAKTMSFVNPLDVGADSAARFVSAVIPVLMLLERLPYVGKVLKIIQLRRIFKAGRNKVSAGRRTLNPFEATVSTGHQAVIALPAKVVIFQGFLDGLPEKFELLGRSLVRLHRCAFIDGNSKLIDTLKSVTDRVTDAVDTAYGAMSSIRQVLTDLGDFWTKIENTILKPIGAVKRRLDLMNKIFDIFRFLQTLYEFKLKFKIPIIGRIEFGLADIANFIGKIERTIKKIPFVGSAWRAVEKIISTVMEAIFPKIELPLPSLNFLDALSPFDKLEETIDEIVDSAYRRLTEAADVVDNWVGDIADGLDMDSIFERVSVDLPDFGLLEGCENDSGQFDLSCISSAIPDIPDVPRDFIDDGVEFLNNLKEQMETTVSDNIEAVASVLGQIECQEKSTIGIPEEGLEKMFKTIGINCNNAKECGALFGTGLNSGISFCNKFGLNETSAMEAMQPLVGGMKDSFLELEASSNDATRRQLRRHLSTIADQGLSMIFTVTLPARPLLALVALVGGEAFDLLPNIKGQKEKLSVTANKIATWNDENIKKPLGKFMEKLGGVHRPFIGEPFAGQIKLGSVEVITLNFVVTAREVSPGNIQPTFRITLGSNWRLQAGFGFSPTYHSVVQQGLDEFNKMSDFLKICNDTKIDTEIDTENEDCVNVNRVVEQFKEEVTLDQNPLFKKIEEGIYEAKPWGSFLNNFEERKKAEALARNIDSLTKNFPDIDEIDAMIAANIRHLPKDSRIAKFKKKFKPFFQIRHKARGTEFPRKGIQLSFGSILQVSPRNLPKSFSLRYDSFVANPNAEPDSLIDLHQDKSRHRGNIAFRFNQEHASSMIVATGHVALGFSILSLQFGPGQETSAASFGSTFVGDAQIDDDE